MLLSNCARYPKRVEDVKLDISTGSFAPYSKPNSKLLYVNANCNHPKNIIRSIPKIINDRLTKRSSSEKEFDENKNEYERALKESGYDAKLTYVPQNANEDEE